MSILSALKQQHSSIDDLAKLPQTMIMQMAQKKEIQQEMVAPILARKAELMDAAARSKTLQQPEQAPPSVLEQLIAKNATSENPPPVAAPQSMMAQQAMMPRSVEEAGLSQLPIPERQYAGGGIIAFGGGGMPAVDMGDEEDLAYEMARDDAEMNMGSSIQDIYNMAKRGLGRLKESIPESYEAAKTKVEAKIAGRIGVPESKRGTHPYEADAIAAAKKVGLDPNLMLHALYKETGGHKDPANAVSKAGAFGPMQLMPGTAKDLGVNRKNVQENLLGGARYLKQQVDDFRDPTLGLAAYNAGPGRVRQMVKSNLGIESLKPETQNYVRYSQGGGIKHYAEPNGEQLVQSDAPISAWSQWLNSLTEPTPAEKEFGDTYTKNLQKKRELEAQLTSPEFDIPFYKPVKPSVRKEAEGKIAGIQKERAAVSQPMPAPLEVVTKKPTPAPATPAANAPEPQVDYQAADAAVKRGNQKISEDNIFAQIFARNEQQREDIKKSAAEDKNMALLAAGLGIAGGSSPYFLQNIGTGGAKGLEHLAASKARRSAEMNALSASDLKAMYYGEENKRKNQALGLGMAEKAIDNLAAYDTKLRKNFFMEGVTPTQKQLDAYETAKRNDSIYQRLAKDANLMSSIPTAPVLNYNPKTKSLGS